ncbi:6,7-dimethyl-8-ribityllumazine synthase [Microvenator marinus]|jgi:6,7-dimethyl-8-ribityllumazine synthase|uniref:6,7-dimethyl-8-ribityllumazine synthase n=1 Tax=Microvenator marinus TaxID=2600177 RepID=A0A5B8XWQ5_9DELT|nr:6,7-dimethyl-8-ribityllumazine synthase [Microvenator marinus]QED29621.1 6,7-dimethyl-8-ribityllumazine synthase [Microvenator marinus]
MTIDGVKVVEGLFQAQGKRFGIVASRWNGFFADRLVEGAIDALVRHGASRDDISVVKCPGSFEVPMVTKKLAETKKFDAIISLGVLIRGATPHFDHISAEATKGIASVSMDSGIPVAFGVLTCDSLEQAIERSGSKAGNKGVEAAMAAIEMVSLYDAIEGL